MGTSCLSDDSQKYSATDTVIVAIQSYRNRRAIIDGFRQLGDKVFDWYSETHGLPFSSLFDIPHRLVVMNYRDYKRHRAAIMLHLSRADASIKPILIYGRRWRKIPSCPAIIDGDKTSPDEICRMFWEARGSVYVPME